MMSWNRHGVGPSVPLPFHQQAGTGPSQSSILPPFSLLQPFSIFLLKKLISSLPKFEIPNNFNSKACFALDFSFLPVAVSFC